MDIHLRWFSVLFVQIIICNGWRHIQTADEELNFNNTKNVAYIPDDDGIPRTALVNEANSKSADDVSAKITYTLYTRKAPQGETVKIANVDRTTFDKSQPTKIITHGWRNHVKSDFPQHTKNEYLKYYNLNVIIVDWSPIAKTKNYLKAARRVNDVGRELSKLLKALQQIGTVSSMIHLIGHSLGAHVSGMAGTNLQGAKVGRVTGLDAASPHISKPYKINNSAIFVDVIHTSAPGVGILEPIGMVDFYPNGGRPPQPGCEHLDQMTKGCSHSVSWKLFRNSIGDAKKYPARRCIDYSIPKTCLGPIAYLGEHVAHSTRGQYYLKTGRVD